MTLYALGTGLDPSALMGMSLEQLLDPPKQVERITVSFDPNIKNVRGDASSHILSPSSLALTTCDPSLGGREWSDHQHALCSG
jgi:hypothetical protein